MKRALYPATVATQLLAAMALLLVTTQSAAARAPFLDEHRGVLTIAPVLERATLAVVSVAVASRASGAENPLLRDPLFRRFFGLPEGETPVRR